MSIGKPDQIEVKIAALESCLGRKLEDLGSRMARGFSEAESKLRLNERIRGLELEVEHLKSRRQEERP
jgi:hypothetical protein